MQSVSFKMIMMIKTETTEVAICFPIMAAAVFIPSSLAIVQTVTMHGVKVDAK